MSTPLTLSNLSITNTGRGRSVGLKEAKFRFQAFISRPPRVIQIELLAGPTRYTTAQTHLKTEQTPEIITLDMSTFGNIISSFWGKTM